MMGIDYYQQLALLKGVTVKQGAIHEAQVVQLKNYPLLIKGVTSAETSIGDKLVEYNLFSENLKVTKNTKLAMDKIVELVRKIVWDDTDVVFKVNGNLIKDTRAT